MGAPQPRRRALLLATTAAALLPRAARSHAPAAAPGAAGWALLDRPERLLLLDGASLAEQAALPLAAPLQGTPLRHHDQLWLPDAEGGLARWQRDAAGRWQARAQRRLNGGSAQPLAQEPAQTLAVSADGRWLLHTDTRQGLQLLDAQSLATVKTWPEGDPVLALVDAALRRSFVVASAGALSEISYDPRAEDFYAGLVHDYRMGEGVPQRGYLGRRRMPLAQALTAAQLRPDPAQGQVLLSAPDPGGGTGVQRLNLDVRRQLARLPLGPAPLLAQAWTGWQGRQQLLACSDAEDALLRLVDLDEGRLLAQRPLAAPGARLLGGPGGLLLHWPGAGSTRRAGPPLQALSLPALAPLALPQALLPAERAEQVLASADGRQLLIASGAELLQLDAASGQALAQRRLPAAPPRLFAL